MKDTLLQNYVILKIKNLSDEVEPSRYKLQRQRGKIVFVFKDRFKCLLPKLMQEKIKTRQLFENIG